jgi:hypothetical protein
VTYSATVSVAVVNRGSSHPTILIVPPRARPAPGLTETHRRALLGHAERPQHRCRDRGAFNPPARTSMLARGYSVTQAVPSKHCPAGQRQILTSWLYSGAQPQAPTKQRLGKLPVDSQQLAVVMVPPEVTQPRAGAPAAPAAPAALLPAAPPASLPAAPPASLPVAPPASLPASPASADSLEPPSSPLHPTTPDSPDTTTSAANARALMPFASSSFRRRSTLPAQRSTTPASASSVRPSLRAAGWRP